MDGEDNDALDSLLTISFQPPPVCTNQLSTLCTGKGMLQKEQ
jgi:hypothetical protein